MREILFRGKRLDNGKWVRGSLISFADGGQAILPSGSNAFTSAYGDIAYMEACYAVDFSTVGQYTGLTDKNGVKIFEGDIAQYDDELVVVEWVDEDAMFQTRGLDSTNWTTNFSQTYGSDLEVIGNIHDNPELLEGGAP